MKKASCVVAAVLAFVGYVGAEPVLFTEDGRWTVPTNQWDHVYAASNGLPEVTDARWVTGGYQSTTPGNVNYVRIVNDQKEGDVLMLVHTNSSTANNRWPLYQMQVEPGSGTTNELITVDMRFRLADDSQPDTTSQLALGLARPRLNGTAGRASWYLEFAENGIKKNGALTGTLRCDIPSSQLDNTRRPHLRGREDGSEIEIVREDDISVFSRPSKKMGIRGGRPAHRLPMQCLMSECFQYRAPCRRQIHVDQQVHAGTKGTWISSARHAAYVKASVMSSGSRYGYSARIFSRVYPAATRPTSVPTVTRMPLMHGRPPMTVASNVILDVIPIV